MINYLCGCVSCAGVAGVFFGARFARNGERASVLTFLLMMQAGALTSKTRCPQDTHKKKAPDWVPFQLRLGDLSERYCNIRAILLEDVITTRQPSERQESDAHIESVLEILLRKRIAALRHTDR